MEVSDVLADLVAEQDALDHIVSGLPSAAWSTPTPSPRWTVAHQIAHLTYFDGTARLALVDQPAFQSAVAGLAARSADGEEAVDEFTMGGLLVLAPAALLERWRTGRAALAEAARGLTNEDRIAWYGPSMGSKSFLTARLMECWAHGQDIVDAVGADRAATDRLRHIANLGFLTRGWSYVNRGLDVPTEPVRVELIAPSGAVWTFGPGDAAEAVRGSAEEFCLVVTQRRRVDATALEATPIALDWLRKAQAFAGPPS